MLYLFLTRLPLISNAYLFYEKILIVLALAAAVLGVSCDRPEEPQVKPTLTVSPSELAFAASGNSSKTVTVTAENVGWEITMSDESKAWITVTENSDGKTLTVSVSDNEAETARNGSFTLTPDNVKVDPKRVTVSQEGAEVGDLSFSLDPTALTFDGEGAPAQEVVVAVSDAKLTWTAAPEEAAKDWITVTASGDKISVSVADNPDTTERSGNVIVTPDTKSVNPKAVRVTQKGKVLPPSLSTSVESGKLEFDYSVVVGTTVYVTAVDVNWDAKVSDTPDVVGNPVGWLKVSNITKENVDTPYFSVRPETNTTTEARSAYVVVTSDNPEVPNVTIEVVQAGGKEFLTNLTAPVEITDMGTGVVNDVFSLRTRNGRTGRWPRGLLRCWHRASSAARTGWDIGTIPGLVRGCSLNCIRRESCTTTMGSTICPKAITRWRPMRWMRMTTPFSCRLP